MVNSKVKSSCCNDCQYDISKQIVKRSKFLWAVDGYIKNAKRLKDTKGIKLWESLRATEQKNVELLKKHLGLK